MMSDHFAIRAVIFILGLAGLSAVAAMVFLAMTHTAIPDQLDRIATFSLGVLSGILAKTSTPETPTPVTVVNEADEAVPVAAAPDPPLPNKPTMDLLEPAGPAPKPPHPKPTSTNPQKRGGR